MEKENLTPAQFVELDVITSIEPGTPEWLFSFMPDFEEKMRIWRESGFADSFSKQYFSEAIAAFEAHIRQETWREACEAQRAECVSHYSKICKDSHYDAAVIRNAPIPEIPKNDEK